MANPVLCEVTRGAVVESRHRASVAVVDADGATVMQLGDIDAAVFARSAVKAIQALPLVESGAADAFGFGDRELALACASHGGEPAHTELAASMLARAGLGQEALECGAHWPGTEAAAFDLARSGGEPTALHNNCSGKHSGFLCACVHCGIGHQGYVKRDHPFQREVIATLEQVTGAPHAIDQCGIDGCSIPTHAVPLKALAHGFARMATGTGLAPKRAEAARRLFAACMAEPFYVDGTGHPCTAMLEAGAGEVFAKNGAEGVYCGAIPALGLGIAVKCDDGAGRAAAPIFAAVASRLLPRDSIAGARVGRLARVPLLNRNRLNVGEVRAAGPLVDGAE